MADTEYELAAALDGLLQQTYQMRGMFGDEDGAIVRAVEDAEEALNRYRTARRRKRDLST